jgi:hypothetical protein
VPNQCVEGVEEAKDRDSKREYNSRQIFGFDMDQQWRDAGEACHEGQDGKCDRVSEVVHGVDGVFDVKSANFWGFVLQTK